MPVSEKEIIERLPDWIAEKKTSFLFGSGTSAPGMPLMNMFPGKKDGSTDVDGLMYEIIKRNKFLIGAKMKINVSEEESKAILGTLGAYKKFIEILLDMLGNVNARERHKNINIFTTNYDLFIEKAVDDIYESGSTAPFIFNDGARGYFNRVLDNSNFDTTTAYKGRFDNYIKLLRSNRLNSSPWKEKSFGHRKRRFFLSAKSLRFYKQEEKSEKVNRYIAVIKNRTEMLKQLTEELFRYSVILTSEEDLKIEPITINNVLEESIASFYTILKEKQISPKIIIPQKKIVRNLDRSALSRIFANLLNNAVKYSNGDLEVTLFENGEIHFINHASNLTEIEVGKLFDRFYTVNNARNSTGLGLSISKALVEKMNGTISAEYNNEMLNICIVFDL